MGNFLEGLEATAAESRVWDAVNVSRGQSRGFREKHVGHPSIWLPFTLLPTATAEKSRTKRTHSASLYVLCVKS